MVIKSQVCNVIFSMFINVQLEKSPSKSININQQFNLMKVNRYTSKFINKSI